MPPQAETVAAFLQRTDEGQLVQLVYSSGHATGTRNEEQDANGLSFGGGNSGTLRHWLQSSDASIEIIGWRSMHREYLRVLSDLYRV
jgi:hypothetical protein